jgi:ABC-type transport system involved in multi-copper enzyme maturation permease subunit
MTRPTLSHYRRYTGPIRTGKAWRWWPITRTELTTRVFTWRFGLLYLAAFTPFFFREALLYARFVIAPVRVNMMAGMTSSHMGRLMRWNELCFYSDYLEDRFLWLFLLLTAAVLGVPLVARDLRTRAWEIYFSRAVGPFDYFLGKFVAVFLALFILTAGGVVGLFLTTSLLGPDPAFFADNVTWLGSLLAYAALLSGVLSLAALAFGTLAENGLILSGAWLGVFFVAFCIGRVLRLVRDGGTFDWVDPKYLFLAASSVIHGYPTASGFPAWIAFPLLGAVVTTCLLVLARFLKRQREGLG